MMNFPSVGGGASNCQVEGCPGWATMRVHLLHQHVRDTVIILEEGKLPQPRFPLWDMLVPWMDLNGRHITTAQCAKGAERKRRWLSEEDMRKSTERAFKYYGRPLATVTSFKYLGQILAEADIYWTYMVGNL